jgi:hypothetical protein
MRSRASATVVFLLVIAIGVTAVSAFAGSDKSGRVLFTKRADNICQKKTNDARRKVQRGVRYLEHRRLRPAGVEFAGAYRELREGYHRIGRLHRPVRGHKHIAKWLHREGRATAAGVDAAVALQHHHLEKAARLTHKSAHLERLAYKPVQSFDFDHCAPI